jgi:peptide/nickel transport system ATP-binding protein
MKQRVGIVFALVLNAHVLILDEPTTALDMLSQASVLDIIRKVHASRHLTTLIISHDIGVIADLADRVAVMYAGRIVEEGPVAPVLTSPRHPYTRGLMEAMPRLTGSVTAARPLDGRPPDLASIPRTGCVFRPRCAVAVASCAEAEPPSTVFGPRRFACFVASAAASAVSEDAR